MFQCNLWIFLKFRYYERATKFEKISHLFWQNKCFHSVVSKQVEYFFKFLWPFQKSWTLKQICKITRKTTYFECTKNQIMQTFKAQSLIFVSFIPFSHFYSCIKCSVANQNAAYLCCIAVLCVVYETEMFLCFFLDFFSLLNKSEVVVFLVAKRQKFQK